MFLGVLAPLRIWKALYYPNFLAEFLDPIYKSKLLLYFLKYTLVLVIF